MAPIPKKQTPLRTRTTSSFSSNPHTTFPKPTSTFSSTKKDKRTIKHSLFVNRIEKTHAAPKKRRRPNKKLVADLQSLTDALPDATEDGAAGETETIVGQAKIRHKSLKSRPGAMKRKEKLERMERERFGKNMAQMAVGQQGAAGGTTANGGNAAEGTGNRWAALRGFIEGTMEKNAAFQKT